MTRDDHAGGGAERFHVEPRGRQWALRAGGAQQASRLFETKAAAQEAALLRAGRRGGQVVVHDRSGDVERLLRPS